MKSLLAVLNGEKPKKVPVWLMRQAGRYLPEYRALRAEAGGFLNLVFNPEQASEITLQPIRRFAMNGAILFSDILVVPHALGQTVAFNAGEGPTLPPVRDISSLEKLNFDHFDQTLAPVLQTLQQTKQKLQTENFHDTTLIGFAGSPWTVACYMVEGSGSRDFNHAKEWALRGDGGFDRLIKLLIEATVRYLSQQITAGAEAVQLFDSWAGILDEDLFARYVIAPTRAIVENLRKQHPDVPIIGFPRGAGVLYERYALETKVNALGLDYQVPLAQAKALQRICPVQGNLDPAHLLTGGKTLDAAIDRILTTLADGPFIFNLGHGVIKETLPEDVQQLITRVRA